MKMCEIGSIMVTISEFSFVLYYLLSKIVPLKKRIIPQFTTNELLKDAH